MTNPLVPSVLFALLLGLSRFAWCYSLLGWSRRASLGEAYSCGLFSFFLAALWSLAFGA